MAIITFATRASAIDGKTKGVASEFYIPSGKDLGMEGIS